LPTQRSEQSQGMLTIMSAQIVIIRSGDASDQR
jgi:hypothetical protein